MGRGRATALLPILVEGMLWMRLEQVKPAKLFATDSSFRELCPSFGKACLLVAIVFLISLGLSNMPSPAVALFWMLFTLFSTLGMLYLVTIRKVHIQMKYVNSGIAATVNNGRIISIIVSFFVSAICMASLLLESPKWDLAVWAIVLVALALYPLISMMVERFVRRQYEQVFCLSAKVIWTCTILGLLMCASYCVWSYFDGVSQQSYKTVFQALINTRQPLVNANSSLLQEAGIGLWLSESITNFGMDQISKLEAWKPVCAIIRVVVSVGAFFGMAHLLSICSVPCGEFKKGFASIADIKNSEEVRVRIRYVLVAALLLIALVGAFVWADDRIDEALQSKEGTALQSLTHRVAGTSVYRIDDAFYDPIEFNAVVSANFFELNERINTLRNETIPTAYVSCGKGIDGFLEWFFSIAKDNSVREDISKRDNIRQVMQENFYRYVGASGDDGADYDEQLTQQVNGCIQCAEDLTNLLKKGEGCDRLRMIGEPSIPSWLVDSTDVANVPEFDSCRRLAQGVIDVARVQGVTASLRNNQTLLEFQFSKFVYSDKLFNSMVGSVEDITGEDYIIPDRLIWLKGMFDEGIQRKGYHDDFETMLDKCRNQTVSVIDGAVQEE